MVAFVGVAELTPINAFEPGTVQIAEEFNERYQALINRVTWQQAENAIRATRLSNALANTAYSDSVTLTATSNLAIIAENNRSVTLGNAVNDRLTQTADTSGITQIEARQTSVMNFLETYTPQPFNSGLEQLANLPKIEGRLLGYNNNQWNYWSKAASDVFEISAISATLERGAGANSNPGFTNNVFSPSQLTTETSDLRNDASVVTNGITLPSRGLTVIFGRQPLIAESGISEIWNASIGGRMNVGTPHIGFINNVNRSSLWTTETMSFAIGDYSSNGNFNYQMRTRIVNGAPTPAWTGGTAQIVGGNAGGNESYNSLFALRFS